MQKTLHKCSGYKQQCVGGRAFFLVSSLDGRSSGDKYFHIIVHNLLANDGDPLMILPPNYIGALLIIFSKLGQGMINFYQFCALGKI